MASFSSITPQLAPGLVSIYGTASIYGFSLPFNSPLTFGVIYKMSGNISGSYSVGQNVLLPYKEAYSINYQNQTYWLIDESKIILVEQAPDSSPAP